MFGRDEETWDELVDAGERFLFERARMQRTTSYTELNAALVNRTGARGFDFERAEERAAMGQLLFRIVDRTFSETGLMLSALVQYLDANDAGPGFYKLAQDKGLLNRRATADEKLAFWLGQVKQLHQLYAQSGVGR